MSSSVVVAATDFLYRYNAGDDMLSLRRWLARSISPSTVSGINPSGDDPYLYVEPIEGTFTRPAVTLELVDQGKAGSDRANAHTYAVLLSVELRAYGIDRDHTIELGERVWNALNDMGTDRAPYRPQMWAFAATPTDQNGNPAAPARLARRMSVVQTSLSMQLLQTNDEGKWARPISMHVSAPRLRSAPAGPVIQQVQATIVPGAPPMIGQRFAESI